jgi:retron-type reverse transcriptase
MAFVRDARPQTGRNFRNQSGKNFRNSQMESLRHFITEKLKLRVNEAKSAVARPQERKFLGFSFTRSGG